MRARLAVAESPSASSLRTMARTPIYLDNLASTRVDPRVLDAMLPYFTEHFGNAASKTHPFGWRAARAVEQGRSEVASLIGASSAREIVFTSGATEAINLAIKGVAAAYHDRGNHIITSAIEHRAVLDCCRSLQRRGYEITSLPVDNHGLVDPEQLRHAITPRTILISIMAANNEIGTVQPLAEIGDLARERGILWHCDAAQAVGKVGVDVEELGVDLLSLSGHKIYGPKGIGALYLRGRRPRVRLRPQLEGGGQERGLRSGTQNVPGIVGLGMACRLCEEHLECEGKRLGSLRQRLHHGLASRLDGVRLNGHPDQRIPGSLNLSFAQVDGAALVTALGDIAVSSGAACTSGSTSPSHVLRAIGLDDQSAFASLRICVGRFNSDDEIDHVIERIATEVNRLRDLALAGEADEESKGSLVPEEMSLN